MPFRRFRGESVPEVVCFDNLTKPGVGLIVLPDLVAEKIVEPCIEMRALRSWWYL